MDDFYYQKYGSPPRENPLTNFNIYGKSPLAPANTSGSISRSNRPSNVPPPSNYIEHGDPVLDQSTSSMMYSNKDPPLINVSPKIDYPISYPHQLPLSSSKSPNSNPMEKYFSRQELKIFEEYNRYLVMSSPERQKKFFSTLSGAVYKRFNDYLDMESKLKSVHPVGMDSSAVSPTYRDLPKKFSSSYSSYFDNNESIYDNKEIDDLISPVSNSNYQRTIHNSGNYSSHELPTHSASYYYARQYDQPKNAREDYPHYMNDNFDNDYLNYRHRSNPSISRERQRSPNHSSRERYLSYREKTSSPSGFSHHSSSSRKYNSRNSSKDRSGRFGKLVKERISQRKTRSRSPTYRSLKKSRSSISRRDNLKENREAKAKITKEKEKTKELKRESTVTAKSSSDTKNSSLVLEKNLREELTKKRSRNNSIAEKPPVKKIKTAKNSASNSKLENETKTKSQLNTSGHKELKGKPSEIKDQKSNNEKVEKKEKKFELPITSGSVEIKNYKIPKISTKSKLNEKNGSQVLTSNKEKNRTATSKKPNLVPKASSSSEKVSEKQLCPPYSPPTKEEINEKLLAFQWCHLCRIFFETPSDFFLHIHCHWHQTRLGTSDFQIIKKAEDKMSSEPVMKDENYLLTTSASSSSANSEISLNNGKNQDNQFIGTEFFYPLLSFYCDLCEKFLPNKQLAQEHSCSVKHSTLYKKYMKKNLTFYKKFNQNRFDDFVKTHYYDRFLSEHKQRYHKESQRLILEKANEKVVKETLEYILNAVCNPKKRNQTSSSSKDKIERKSQSTTDSKERRSEKARDNVERNKTKLNNDNKGNKNNIKIENKKETPSSKQSKKVELLPAKKTALDQKNKNKNDNENKTKSKDTAILNNSNNSVKNKAEPKRRKASETQISPKKDRPDSKSKKVEENLEMEEEFDVIDEVQ